MLFEGKIDSGGNCVIPIKKMKGILEEGEMGVMKLEVIADDTLFIPFEENFSVKTHRKVTIDVQENKAVEEIKENKVAIKVFNINSTKPKKRDSQVISELLTLKGINKSNIGKDKNINFTSQLVENYVKKFQVTTPPELLISEVLNDLK